MFTEFLIISITRCNSESSLGISINQDVSVIAQFEKSTIIINDEIDD